MRANHQLASASRLDEELTLFKSQYAEAAERLQAALAARDQAASEASQARTEGDALRAQLASARGAMGQQAMGVDKLRSDLEAALKAASEARAAHLRARNGGSRLEACVASLTAELRLLDGALHIAEESRVSSEARAACDLSALSDVLRESDHALATASAIANRAGAEARKSVAHSSAAASDAQKHAETTAAALSASEEQARSLTVERDDALTELAAQKRVVDSLRQELRKAMKGTT